MKFNPVLRFLVTSDVHYKKDSSTERERFEAAMRIAYAYAEKSDYKKTDALFVVGDFANSGSEEEMMLFKKSLDSAVSPDTEVTLMLASHEFKDSGEEKAIERLEKIFHQQPDNHKLINGYHFISVSTEQGCCIRDKKKKWLKKQLEEAAADGYEKPIFCFQHPHLSGTVYGSINWGDDDIISILMDYPQVVDFSGHSHAPINDPRSVHQKYFSSFGTGAFSYFELDEFDKMYGTVPPDAKQCAQYLIVEADADNRLRVIPVDVISGQFFNDGRLIESPSKPESFIYTDKRYHNPEKPYFLPDTDISVKCSDTQIHISFPQAKSDSERINSYTVILRSNCGGRIIAQKNVSSSYYLYDMPKYIELQFDFRAAAGSYCVEIIANGFWYNESEKISKSFKL